MARFGQMTKDHMAKGQISRSPTTQVEPRQEFISVFKGKDRAGKRSDG